MPNLAPKHAFDNTRLSDFKRCPRLYYFRHIMAWVPEGTKPALAFGAAWHKALERVWIEKPVKPAEIRDTMERAYNDWLDEWEAAGMPRDPSEDELKELLPRTPGVAYDMLLGYIENRKRIWADSQNKLLTVEQPFAVPLDPHNPELFYIGMIDKVVEMNGRVIGIEHKTTTAYKKGNVPFRATFLESWSPNSQVDGYHYALHILYPDRVGGVWVDAALVHKADEGYTFIPIERQLQHLDAWLWSTRWWISRVMEETAALERCSPEHRVMQAFPQNTNSCFDFNTACAYIDCCKAWANPVGKQPPLNMHIEKWDPLAHLGHLNKLEVLDSLHATS